MPRGGKRLGSGGKFKWNNGKTKVVRIPEAIADQLLEFAKLLDQGGNLLSVTPSNFPICYDAVTSSKVIDLSGILVRSVSGQPAVFLSDLVRIGYQILPERLAQSASLRAALQKQDRVDRIKTDISRLSTQEELVYD